MKEKKHLLVVDDVNTNLKCLGQILKDDYTLSLVKSGEKALEVLEKIHPDVIVMDVKMPGMDGFDTLSMLRKEEKNCDIPVLFLSADVDTDSEERALKTELSDYLRKPFEPYELKERIEKILEHFGNDN